MNRYIECDESLVSTFLEVLEERFPGYQNLNIKLVFDTKKRVKGGSLRFATIEAASDKIKFFSKDNVAVEGYDYIMIVDALAWELMLAEDKKRLISHELCHIFIDENGNYKTIAHDIEDFYSEIELNQDKPRWKEELGIILGAAYDQRKENKTKDGGVINV